MCYNEKTSWDKKCMKKQFLRGKIMDKLTYQNQNFIFKYLIVSLLATAPFLFFFVSRILVGEEKQLFEQTNNSDSQDVSSEPNETKIDLEKTKEIFNNAFNTPGKEEIILRGLIQKANEEEKNWIRDALINRFNSEPDPRLRQMCLVSIGWFRDAAAKLHVKALSDTDRSVRKLAAYCLGKSGSEQDIDALFQAVKDDKGVFGPGRDIAKNAISSIGEIGGTKAARVLNEIWLNEELSKGFKDAILGSLGSTGDPNVFEILEEGLRGNDERIRDNAAYGLGQLAIHRNNRKNSELANKVTQLLRSYINDKNPRVRNNIVRAFSIIGKREDIPLLKTLLEDDYSTTVSYTEDGEVKKRTEYPIRKAAREAIDNINRRLPAEKSDSIPNR